MTVSVSGWMRGAAMGAGLSLVLAMAPAVAQAGVVSETVSYPSATTNWTTALDFAGFDSFGTGGVLESVSVTLTETMNGSIDVTNGSSTSQSGTASLQNVATLQVATLDQVTNTQTTGTLTLAASGQPGDSSGSVPLAGSTSATATYTGSDLAYFLDPYSGDATDTAYELLSFGGGNVTATYTDAGALSVTVDYTYGPATVPEPATFALLGTALLGLGLIRFKRS